MIFDPQWWLTTFDAEFWVALAAAIAVAVLAYVVRPVRRLMGAVWRNLLAVLGGLRVGRRLRRIGVTNVYLTRQDWARFRKPSNLTDYLLTATVSVDIVCYWMAQGSLEGVPAALGRLAERGVRVRVAMIDPTSELPAVLARDLANSATSIRSMVRTAGKTLATERSKLSQAGQSRFAIVQSSALCPVAAIVIDGESKGARIQLEYRSFGLDRSQCLSFEIRRRHDAALFSMQLDSLNRYLSTARPAEGAT